MQEENIFIAADEPAEKCADAEAEKESVEQLKKDYALLQEKYHALQKQNTLEKICGEAGCTDPEYFEFCAKRAGIQPDDPETLRDFARELAAVSPGCFIARITPGSNAGNSHTTASAGKSSAEVPHGDRISMLAASISDAPDAVCR